MDFFVTFNQIALLFVMVLAGLIIGKCGVVSDRFTKDLSNFLLAAPLPCMIFNSMNVEFSREKAGEIFFCLGVGTAMLVIALFLSRYIVRVMKITDRRQIPVYRFALGFPNFGFMGLPVCQALYGDEGVMLCAIFGVAFNAAFYIYGDILFATATGEKEKTTWRKFVTPVNIGTLLGLLVFFTPLQTPAFVTRVTEMMGGVTPALAMMIVGLQLGANDIRTVLKNPKVFIYSGIRLVLFPLLMLGILKLCGMEGMMLLLPVTMASLPAAANMLVLAERHDADTYLGAQLIFVSTLLSMATIPLILSLAM